MVLRFNRRQFNAMLDPCSRDLHGQQTTPVEWDRNDRQFIQSIRVRHQPKRRILILFAILLLVVASLRARAVYGSKADSVPVGRLSLQMRAGWCVSPKGRLNT